MIPPQYSNAGVLYAAAPNYPVPPVAMAGFPPPPPPGNHPPALATHQQGYPSPPGTQQPSIGPGQQSPTQAGQQVEQKFCICVFDIKICIILLSGQLKNAEL